MISLGNVVSLIKGKKAPGASTTWKPGMHRYIQIQDLRPGAEPRYVHEYNNELAQETDILIAWDGANAGTASFGLHGYPGSTITILRPRSKDIHTPFLGYFLKSRFEYLQDTCTGATIPHVSRRALLELALDFPSLTRQKRIAAILDKSDRLRRLRSYARKLSDTFLQSVFLEMFGDPVRNPKGWPIIRLGKVLSFVTSGPRGWARYYSPKGIRFIRSLDVQMNRIDDENAVFVSPPENAEEERTRAMHGDILLTITGSRIGRVAYVPNSMSKAYVSQHVSIIRLDGSVRPDFASMFLSLPRGGQLQIARMQYGQTKPGLNFKSIRSLEIPTPPIELQIRFAGLTLKFEGILRGMCEGERQGEHLFQTLLHRAFRGEL